MITNLVSIIIPTYNRAHLIGETLDSVLAQTYQNWECIVVDDGSTDGTEGLMAEYIAKDSRFQYHHRPADRLQGGNAARNYGFEVSTGEFIQWFDSDDIMLPEYLEKKIAAFSKNNVLTICTGYSVDQNLGNRKLKLMPPITNLFKEYVLWNSKIMSPSIIFRRTFLESSLLFDEKLLRGQENELFSRLFFKLPTTNYNIIPDALYLYRQHSNTKSFEDKNSYRSEYRKSLGRVSVANLNRGFQLRDLEIINYHYRIVIHYLFGAIHQKDSQLGWYFLFNLIAVIKNNDRYFTVRLMAWIPLFILGGRTIYKIEKEFKNKKFQ